MILGVGATPLLTLGVSYIDENVDPRHSPVYMGVIYCATFVGSTFGLIITGFFLKTFVELELVSQRGTPSILSPSKEAVFFTFSFFIIW